MRKPKTVYMWDWNGSRTIERIAGDLWHSKEYAESQGVFTSFAACKKHGIKELKEDIKELQQCLRELKALRVEDVK